MHRNPFRVQYWYSFTFYEGHVPVLDCSSHSPSYSKLNVESCLVSSIVARIENAPKQAGIWVSANLNVLWHCILLLVTEFVVVLFFCVCRSCCFMMWVTAEWWRNCEWCLPSVRFLELSVIFLEQNRHDDFVTCEQFACFARLSCKLICTLILTCLQHHIQYMSLVCNKSGQER